MSNTSAWIHGKRRLRLHDRQMVGSVSYSCSLISQFGKAIVCSDASAEAARYGFTAVDRPDGFLLLAVVSLGEQITEMSTAPDVRMSLSWVSAASYPHNELIRLWVAGHEGTGGGEGKRKRTRQEEARWVAALQVGGRREGALRTFSCVRAHR